MDDQNSSRREFITGKVFRSDEEIDETGYESAAEETLAKQREESYVEHYSKRAMACQFELVFNAGQYHTAADSAMTSFELIDQLEDQLTIYRDWSEVSKLNQAAAKESIAVEEGLFGLIRKAIDLYELTGGAFDITAASLSDAWGFSRREGRVPSDSELAEIRNRIGSAHLLLDEETKQVRFLREGLAINLGGIGKGYALDRVAILLHEEEKESFLIHGGQSSIVASGRRSGIEKQGLEGWTVGLAHPVWPEKRLAEIQLVDQALGTSGTGRQSFYYQGKKYGHIIDPRTGYPADLILSSTVIAPTAAEADALATACYVLGVEGTAKLCSDRQDVAAMIVTSSSKRGGIEIHTFGLDESRWKRVEDEN